MADGTARGFTSPIYAKSVITFPCPEMPAKGPGIYEIRGLAWSGLGKVKQVDVSLDGGINWAHVRLHGPVLPKALTKCTMEWRWDGSPALLQSRAMRSTRRCGSNRRTSCSFPVTISRSTRERRRSRRLSRTAGRMPT